MSCIVVLPTLLKKYVNLQKSIGKTVSNRFLLFYIQSCKIGFTEKNCFLLQVFNVFSLQTFCVKPITFCFLTCLSSKFYRISQHNNKTRLLIIQILRVILHKCSMWLFISLCISHKSNWIPEPDYKPYKENSALKHIMSCHWLPSARTREATFRWSLSVFIFLHISIVLWSTIPLNIY